MKKIIFNCLILLLCWGTVSGQSPSASITTWKYNSNGAYTIIHDDFGSPTVSGIENYADTIAYNRGIKITFGAISGECDAANWNDAKRMISHGHEIINHSHNHYCGRPVDWCETQYWTEADFAIEIDLSTSLIESNTGEYPRFFIFPYDLHTDTMLTYLKSKQYLGARAGTQDQYNHTGLLNSADFSDPFRLNYFVFAPTSAISDLNGAVDLAINNNSWAIRETHGVGDPSWGSISVSNYINHMNYLKSKVEAGQLWVATPSEVITYQSQRKAYSPVVSSNAVTGDITVSWNNILPVNINLLKTPVTVAVNLGSFNGQYVVYQDGEMVSDIRRSGQMVYFEVYPHKGSVLLTKECQGNEICITKQPLPLDLNAGEGATFTVEATSQILPLTYQWQKNGVNIPGAIQSTFSIASVTSADAGTYSVVISNGQTSKTSSEVVLTVFTQAPYNGIVQQIPGKVEAENYDTGGQNVAYFDDTPGNEGEVYRFDDVDIEDAQDTGGGYNVGWTGTGEWLEYTVNVQYTAPYTIVARVASEDFGAKAFSLSIDGAPVVVNANVPYTGGWQTWQDVTLNNIDLTQGQHILRLTFTGVFNINYLDFSTNVDCNGTPNGTAFIDNCNTCVGGTTGLTACVQDCSGDWGGTAYLDNCNTCVGGNTGKQACTQDCNGEWGGMAYLDNCNTCVGGTTGLTACVQDCNGDWGGSASLDICGNCAGGNTGVTPVTNPVQCITSTTSGTYLGHSLYPNPFNEEVTIVNESQQELMIMIMDANSVILETSIIKSGASLEAGRNLPQGLYFLIVTGPEGSKSYKIIKQ
ncbi:MAG TPA: carbohydrate-binding protein [Cytophagaceae bacterium]